MMLFGGIEGFAMQVAAVLVNVKFSHKSTTIKN